MRAVSSGAKLEAPGQLPSHYAPATPVSLLKEPSNFVQPQNKRCGLLAWRTTVPQFCEARILSEKGDLPEAAANLFRFLRELDHANLDLIIAEEVPNEGLGKAINDRLRRAAQR